MIGNGGDVFKDKSSDHYNEHQKFMSTVNRLVSEWKDDKKGLIFQETSRELRHPTLKQVEGQETRWARAEVGVLRNFTRNAPTIYVCLGQQMEVYRKEGNNTAQKRIESQLKDLRDYEFWAYIIGKDILYVLELVLT